MEFVIIQRDSDGHYMCVGEKNVYFDYDIRNAIMYHDEDHAKTIAEGLSLSGRECSIRYVYLTVSDTKLEA